MSVKQALKMQEKSSLKKAYASKTDPIREQSDLGEAAALAKESARMLKPEQPLVAGAGGEIIPPAELGMSGLESVLKEPDLLDAQVTVQRTQLADSAGVFEMAVETAQSVKAKNSTERMLAHQMAAAHHHAMRLLAEANQQGDPQIKSRLINSSTRLMEAFCKGALTLQRLQTGSSQVMTIQHVQINAGGQAIVGNVRGNNEK
jgi:hypothetical protein